MTAPELRRHIREFLEANGEDRRFAGLSDELRVIERRLGETGDERAEANTPGQRAASKASGADETSGGRHGFPPRGKVRDEMGGSSATGDDASLPPFLRRARRAKGKGRAAAQSGSY